MHCLLWHVLHYYYIVKSTLALWIANISCTQWGTVWPEFQSLIWLLLSLVSMLLVLIYEGTDKTLHMTVGIFMLPNHCPNIFPWGFQLGALFNITCLLNIYYKEKESYAASEIFKQNTAHNISCSFLEI